MTSVESIERSIEKLTREDFHKLYQWFLEFSAEVWDKQIEADAASGTFDSIAKEALNEYNARKVREI